MSGQALSAHPPARAGTAVIVAAMSGEPMYEPFAQEYAAHAADSAFNAYYDRPALLALAGDVAGRTVLDAACGPGLYAEELVRRGARVVGCDQSPTLVDLARSRAPQADLRVHDLADPLVWLADDSVDLVVLALALHYVDDRVALLAELHRVLTPSGAAVVSTQHPTEAWLRLGGSYHAVDVVVESLKPERDWPVRYWRRALTHICGEFREAGFLVDQLVEPQPLPELEQRDLEAFRRLSEAPAFIAFRLVPGRER